MIYDVNTYVIDEAVKKPARGGRQAASLSVVHGQRQHHQNQDNDNPAEEFHPFTDAFEQARLLLGVGGKGALQVDELFGAHGMQSRTVGGVAVGGTLPTRSDP